MSKVKLYFDSKQKTRHRLRRYETEHKKFTRAHNYDIGIYPYHCGYFVEREKSPVTYNFYELPNGQRIQHPIFETPTEEVFIVRKITKDAKYLRKQASRKLRNCPCDNELFAARGNSYKKVYDVEWAIW